MGSGALSTFGAATTDLGREEDLIDTAASRIACARCRRLKIKCEARSEQAGCTRCVAASAACREAISTRKPKRKAIDRVAQLEATVTDLTNTIHEMRRQYAIPSATVSPTALPISASLPLSDLKPTTARSSLEHDNWEKMVSSSTTSRLNKSDCGFKDKDENMTGIDDLMNSRVLTQEKTVSLLDAVKARMSSGFSIVRLPLNIDYSEMYHRSPIVLQALITIGSSTDPVLYTTLCQKMKDNLLNEFFVKNTRTLDLLQGLLLACEYFPQSSASTVWNSHSYAALATEVALDLNLYGPPSEPRSEALDDLEYERTLLGLFLVHCSMLCTSGRQPQRVLWTDYHSLCKNKLEGSTFADRELAILTQVTLLHVEIQEAGPHLRSEHLLHNFQRRISTFGTALESGSPRATVAINQVTLALHTSFIGCADLGMLRSSQLFISKDICKTTAFSTLYAVEFLPGNAMTTPTYILAKPLHSLISVCKIFRYLKITEEEWAQQYADKYNSIMAAFEQRGSTVARHFRGIADLVLRWWKEAEITMNDSPIQVLKWHMKISELEKVEQDMDIEFRNFIEYDIPRRPYGF